MTTPDRSTLLDLIARLEADGPSWELDNAIHTATGGAPELTGISLPKYCGSIDAAVALLDRVLPGAWYVLARGKTRAEEPLYGARILFGADTSLGDGEHDAEQAIALCIALLKALVEKTDD